MADIPTFHNLSLERHGNVFVLTMQKPPENRLNSSYCQEMIRAYRVVEKLLGPDSEGAVITRGSDAKFWCTVCGNVFRDSDEFANTKASRDWN
jgi:enoyl-CoA hydratase/carnithine racemase